MVGIQKSFTRVNRPPSAAEAYYTVLAPWYDLLAASEKKYILQGVELLNPSPGESILEIGFGTGYAQLQIAGLLKGGRSAGLDLSTGMCRIAHNKIARAGLAEQINLIQSNSLPIPFQSNVFDGIFTSFTLELFDSPHIPTLLEECRRVLKRGGRFVVVSLSKDRPLPWMGKMYERLHTHFPTLLDCRPIPVRSLVREAGFMYREDHETRMWGLPVILLLVVK
jgi:demethylmenaquinone methyltransferase/2-methoxy-6-polyprenyl-1,4-benzoquinol methylase